MKNNKNGFTTIIVIALVVGVLAIGGAVAAFLYVTSTTNPQTQSSAAFSPAVDIKPKTDSEAGFKLPDKTATAAALVSPAVTSAPPAPSAQTLSLGSGQIDITSSLSSDKKTMTVDFKSGTNFAGVNSIVYSLTYDSDSLASQSGKRAIAGTITVRAETISLGSDGKNYIRKILTIGTCSSGSCVYDVNPHNFRLSVTTK